MRRRASTCPDGCEKIRRSFTEPICTFLPPEGIPERPERYDFSTRYVPEDFSLQKKLDITKYCGKVMTHIQHYAFLWKSCVNAVHG